MEPADVSFNELIIIDKSTRLRDKIRGMFAGLFLGDSLDAAHEFYK